MNIKVEFAKRLQSCIDDKWPGLRQKEYAPKLGVSQATISDWLNAKKMPSLETLIEISLVFGVTIDWLGTGRGSRHPVIIDNNPPQMTEAQTKALKSFIEVMCK
jgi:transcriptional regulator with XRE-family HTH domain